MSFLESFHSPCTIDPTFTFVSQFQRCNGKYCTSSLVQSVRGVESKCERDDLLITMVLQRELYSTHDRINVCVVTVC
jgi:hypothetical protein